MHDRLLGGDGSHIDHLLHDGVVLRELPDLPLPHEVGAAVADVRNLGGRGVYQHGDTRRTGTPRLRPRSSHVVDHPARLRDRSDERGPRRRAWCNAFDRLDDCAQRELTRLLAESVPAHAVANDEQVTELGRLVTCGVLVDLLVRIAAGITVLSDFEQSADHCRFSASRYLLYSRRTLNSTGPKRSSPPEGATVQTLGANRWPSTNVPL